MLIRLLKVGTSVNTSKLYYTKLLNKPLLTAHCIECNYNNDQRRYYKNFGYKPEKTPLISKIFYTLVFSMFMLPLLDYKWYMKLIFHDRVFKLPIVGLRRKFFLPSKHIVKL